MEEKKAKEPQPFRSFGEFRELIWDQDPDMKFFVLRLEYASIGHPLPSRFQIFEPCKWKLYWDLAPDLTVTALRVKDQDGKDDYFLVYVNGEVYAAAYSKEEFEKALATDILVCPLKIYKRAQWFKEQVPYPQLLEWNKDWACVSIGKALTVHVYDEGNVLLSYRVGGLYLETKEPIQVAASAVKRHIEECLINK